MSRSGTEQSDVASTTIVRKPLKFLFRVEGDGLVFSMFGFIAFPSAGDF
jgi:hypothetical protein